MKFNLRQAAIHYHNLGFNVTHIIPQRIINEKSRYEYTLKEPSHRYHSLKSRRQDLNTMLSYCWEEASGVGIVMGYKQVRSIDIDGCTDPEFIKTLLESLGLPDNYEWVVRTGSGTGFQIIIFCNEHPYEIPKGKVVSLLPKRQYKSKFAHLELLWTNHIVLPPSKHVTGKLYEFLSGKTPVYPPRKVDKRLLLKFIERVCRMHGEDETKGSYYENFLSDEYAFMHKMLSYGSHLYKFYKPPFYFFIDIKTNELPYTNLKPLEEPEKLPEIVQIATLVCDSLGKRVNQCNFLIKPDGWKIRKEVKDYMKINEIRKSSSSFSIRRDEYYIMDNGTGKYEPQPALHYVQYRYDLLYNQLYCLFGIFDSPYPVQSIVGYNIGYQLNCLRGLYLRKKKEAGYNEFTTLIRIMIVNESLNKRRKICMMKISNELLGFKTEDNNKYTELKELYSGLFNEELEGANDAKNDVYNIAKCYWNLRDLGQIND